MAMQFNLEGKTYLLVKIAGNGSDFKIENFKQYAQITYKLTRKNEDWESKIQIVGFPKLLTNAKIIGTLSDIYKKKVSSFKKGDKAKLLMKIVDLHLEIDRTYSFLLVQLL